MRKNCLFRRGAGTVGQRLGRDMAFPGNAAFLNVFSDREGACKLLIELGAQISGSFPKNGAGGDSAFCPGERLQIFQSENGIGKRKRSCGLMAVGIQKSGMPGRRETFTLLQILFAAGSLKAEDPRLF